ncbi:MAG: endonuclease/exonuclease/phosphatase family protein [Rhodobacteraceae bacterium]|nr:endonuclease/exonuclease/phosphatase family protein [Paracoccaceae bacterium]
MRTRVASYNIHKSVGMDYRRDPLRVLKVLAAIGADVVAIQEADRRFGLRVSTLPSGMLAEAGLQAVDLAVRPDSIGWHGNAILVRSGTEVLRRERLDLPGVEPRGAVLVDLWVNGVALRVVGVHLALIGSHRKAQVHRISSHIQGLPDMPTVVLGDFNEWSRSGKNLTGFGAGFNLHRLGKSYPTPFPVAGLDRIALSRDLKLADGGVHRCKSAKRASDHLPIWADIAAA